MTLFIQIKNRLFEIDDAYVMGVVFLLTFITSEIVTRVFLHYKENKNKKGNVNIPNPTGGDKSTSLGFDTSIYDPNLVRSILYREMK